MTKGQRGRFDKQNWQKAIGNSGNDTLLAFMGDQGLRSIYAGRGSGKANGADGKGGKEGKGVKRKASETEFRDASMPKAFRDDGGYPILSDKHNYKRVCYNFNIQRGCSGGAGCPRVVHVCGYRLGLYACGGPRSMMKCPTRARRRSNPSTLVPITPLFQRLSVLEVFNIIDNRLYFCFPKVLGFWASSAVLGFHVVARLLQFLLCHALHIPCTQFYDDFAFILLSRLASAGMPRILNCVDLFGWDVKTTPGDLFPPAVSFDALGVNFEFSEFASSYITVKNKEGRMGDFLAVLDEWLVARHVDFTVFSSAMPRCVLPRVISIHNADRFIWGGYEMARALVAISFVPIMIFATWLNLCFTTDY